MSPLRRLADDLVEKHLWPIALLLVVALIAIPLVIGGGSVEPADQELATSSPAAQPVAKSTAAVELVGPPAVRSRPGKVRDPFRRKPPKAAKTEKPSSSPASGAAPKAGSATGGASTKSGSGSASKPATTKPSAPPPAPAPLPRVASLASRSVYETVAHFQGGGLDYEHPLARLAALGDRDSPALLYLGVSRGGEYAIFLLGPAATAGGEDGACIVADSCRAIGLRTGDKLKVEVARPGTTSRHYTLELTSLRRVARSSRAVAKHERQRVAKGGRDVLHALAEDLPTAAALGQLRYGPGTGTVALVRAP
jgi:hypothetical protein